MKKQTAAVYGIAEFATKEMAKQWMTGEALIFAALSKAGKEHYTEEEAKKIIEKYKCKEVL